MFLTKKMKPTSSNTYRAKFSLNEFKKSRYLHYIPLIGWWNFQESWSLYIIIINQYLLTWFLFFFQASVEGLKAGGSTENCPRLRFWQHTGRKIEKKGEKSSPHLPQSVCSNAISFKSCHYFLDWR